MTVGDRYPEDSFTWLLGIEDTCVYPANAHGAILDEHTLTGHRVNWREDLTLAKKLGARAIRYGVSWPVVHVAPGVFDWAELDEVFQFAVKELGLDIVADLVHYGTPPWLADSFADPGYPDAIEAFAGALAERYRDMVWQFTPLNEPITTASFCGLRGVWPPNLTGWGGWVSVAVPIAIGIVRTMRAIRAVQPNATIVHVEAASLISADHSDLIDHADLLRMVGWIPTDLIAGRVDPQSTAWAWLLDHGAAEDDLRWLQSNGALPDVMGVNYYPDLTPRRLENVDGEILQVSYDRWTQGFREAVTAFGERYSLPLIITETSIEGDEDLRADWLRASVAEISLLRADGHDIRGFTWWPLFDFVDWSWASGGQNVEEFAVAHLREDGTTRVAAAPPLGNPADGKGPFLRRMGLVRLDEQADSTLTRVPTAAAWEFRRLSEQQP